MDKERKITKTINPETRPYLTTERNNEQTNNERHTYINGEAIKN